RLLPVSRGLTLAKLFEYPHLAIGLHKHLAAALGFGLDLDNLGGELSVLRGQHQFVAVRLQQSIHVGGSRRLKLPPALRRFRLLLFERPLFAAQHLLGAERFRQLGAALVALDPSQAKQRFQAKAEHREAYWKNYSLENDEGQTSNDER